MFKRTLGVLTLAVMLASCSGLARQSAPGDDYRDAVPVGFPPSVRGFGETVRAIEAPAAGTFDQVRSAAGSGPINVLALSGGGAGGAFGAGALVGWSQAGNRPQFQIVTGVSVGAIIAPFAFLGSGWDSHLSEAFSGRRTEHLLQSRWIGSLLGNSAYSGEPLAGFVDELMTEELLRAVASESGRGRLLLVATTDLDHEETVVWNLGVIAAQGGSDALQLFRNVIVASASVPGMFPPVTIRVAKAGRTFDEMHVDGGTTASLFIAPDMAALLRDPLDGMHGANEYVLLNGQFGTATLTTPERASSILRRSVHAGLQSGSRAAVVIAYSFAQRHDMNFRVTAIPDSYPYQGSADLQPERMQALFAYGARCALAGQLWPQPQSVQLRVEQPRAPTVAMVELCPAEADKPFAKSFR